MRRRYIVICSFFIASLLLAGMCYGSYRYSERVAEEKARQKIKEQTEETASGKEQRVTSETKYILEVYNADTEELVKEERSMPSEYAGMTRKELEEYLSKCLQTMKTNDTEAGLSDMKLISFSKEELVIRKTYLEPEQEQGFFLKLTDGEVAIYNRSGTRLYEKTGIQEEVLPKEEADKLRQGYVVENEKDLYSILENLSS